MWHGKHGKGGCLCPFSLGLALGITSALAVLVWSAWVMYYGVSPMMTTMDMPVPTWETSFAHAGWALLKGFIFGFVLALFYDLFACMFKSWRRDGGAGCPCGDNCKCCEPRDKTRTVDRM